MEFVGAMVGSEVSKVELVSLVATGVGAIVELNSSGIVLLLSGSVEFESTMVALVSVSFQSPKSLGEGVGAIVELKSSGTVLLPSGSVKFESPQPVLLLPSS